MGPLGMARKVPSCLLQTCNRVRADLVIHEVLEGETTMAKNIVIFSDGTGQDGGAEPKKGDHDHTKGGHNHNTNVYKLFNMVEDRSDRQVTFYDRGLGTGRRKLLGKTTGLGISKNILECYEFIFNNFESGDDIYLFGFSRGATTVRSLSSFIHLFGILPKSRPELIEQAYRIYKTSDKTKRNDRAKKLVDRHHTMWTKIKFLGVWDTVDALGIPIKSIDVVVDKIPFFRHKFQDLRLSESVEHARHALAIDDERLTFHPKLWDESIKSDQTMKQVWFPGMHTDVGGGYHEQGLSDIPLIWMLNEAKQHDLHLWRDHQIPLHPDPNGIMHDSRGTRLTRRYRKRERSWDYDLPGKPVVHEGAVLRTRNKSNSDAPEYAPWILDKPYDVEPWPKDLRAPGRFV